MSSLLSGGPLQQLEVIDVVLDSSGSIVYVFRHWLGGVL